MEKFQLSTKFRLTEHAIERFRQRFHPDLSDDKAAEILKRIARAAKPLKVKGGRA